MTKIEMKFLPQQPLEMHKVRIVQKLHLLPLEKRLEAIQKAGNNTFLLRNQDVFLDMLTDSGVNAMSDQQLASMMIADDAYAGSATYYKLEEKVTSLFGLPFFLPAHQGRACEHIIAKTLVKPGMRVPMNYHFTTTKSHIVLQGGEVDELVIDEGLKLQSTHPFKGNMDIEKLKKYFAQY
ncbi:MAG TPA: beta-eliminating lyase-related protein, partial [Bacilli bacterium]|nr:beta-eliminating lyase-related protein [Bacilli bacterium]